MKNKKTIAIIAAAAAIVIIIAAVVGGIYRHQDKNTENIVAQTDSTYMEQIKEPVFDIVTTEGTIRIKLYDKTEKHKENFCKLVKEHYYDSLLFHRVIDGFMIQTGDPYTRDSSKVELYGQGGPGYTIPAEFVNEYWHKKGAIAAARRGDIANPKKSSSGSQFYIVQDEDNCLHLDGEYTIFGETIEGLDIIDKIAAAPVDRYDRPIKDIRIVTITPVLPEGVQTEASDSTVVTSGETAVSAEDSSAVSKDNIKTVEVAQ